MRALLDTHAFLWWVTDDDRLSRGASGVIIGRDNQIAAYGVETIW
jgi:PIN domain nuclease of toxin-antitoxin system